MMAFMMMLRVHTTGTDDLMTDVSFTMAFGSLWAFVAA